MGQVGRGTVETTRGDVLTVDAMAKIIGETGRPITLSALMADEEGKGSHLGLLHEIEAVQEAGYPLWPQVSPRPITLRFTLNRPNMFSHTAPGTVPGADFLDDLFSTLLARPTIAERIQQLRDPAFREAFRARTSSDGWRYLWDKTVVSDYPADPGLNERSMADLAHQQGVHPSEVLLDLGVASALEAVFALTYLNGDEEEVAKLLKHPGTRIGVTDGGAHVAELCDACYPTDLLGHWVRDRKEFSLEEAVAMLTATSASVYGIADRGTLEPGKAADIVVFDKDKVGATKLRKVRDLPGGAERLVSDAEGVDHVVVNGTPLLAGGHVVVDTLPGRLLRSSSKS
jgi:N-acyl-D-aspartate/D-glutamate deacylase